MEPNWKGRCTVRRELFALGGALTLLLAAPACRDDGESSTAPEPVPSLAVATGAAWPLGSLAPRFSTPAV